jgi:surface antigen
VSYVAWRLADAGRPIDNGTQGWGSALDWDEAAQRLGYTVTSRPAVGSVAHWDAHESSTYYANGGTGSFVAGSMGHVAWVTKVYSDGSVQVAQYNGSGDREYSTMHVRAPRYLRL